MSEHSLWVRLRKAIGYSGHFTRIENSVGAGMPDVSYCIKRREGHIELKFREDPPARENTPVFLHHGLRDEQIGWIATRCRHGGLVWILAQVGTGLYLTPGRYAEEYNAMSLPQIEETAAWMSTRGLDSLSLIKTLQGE